MMDSTLPYWIHRGVRFGLVSPPVKRLPQAPCGLKGNHAHRHAVRAVDSDIPANLPKASGRAAGLLSRLADDRRPGRGGFGIGTSPKRLERDLEMIRGHQWSTAEMARPRLERPGRGPDQLKLGAAHEKSPRNRGP
jgi:hypothetical protein